MPRTARNPGRQLKRIVFTLNNYTDEDERRIQEATELFQYAIYGRETAPSTGTRHLQGFINFKSKREFTVIRDLLGGSGHIEPAHGTDQDNKEYCSKDGDFWEFGCPRGQGRRSDLEEVAEYIKSGAREYDVVEKYTSVWFRYYRGIQSAMSVLDSRRDGASRNWKTEVSYSSSNYYYAALPNYYYAATSMFK